MPTYEFRCPDGHTFERFYRKIGDAVSELACPECGKPATRLLTGGAGLVFKGSGFYLTDYGKNAHRTSGDNGGAKPSAAGESASSGGDKGDSGAAKSAESSKSESGGGESKSKDSKSSDPKPSGGAPPASTSKSDK